MRYSLVANYHIKSFISILKFNQKRQYGKYCKSFTERLIDKEISTEPRQKIHGSKENLTKILNTFV